MVLFIFETITAYTVCTLFTFFYAKAISTIHWIFHVKTVITTGQIYAVVDELAFCAKSWVYDIFTFFDEVAVVTIFRFSCTYTQVTIFWLQCMVRVFWIFTKSVEDWYFWSGENEFIHLFKKRPLKIKRFSVFIRTPIIRPPDFLIIDEIRLIWWVEWNYFLPGFIAFSLIHFPLIAKWESSSLSFFWRECWGW